MKSTLAKKDARKNWYVIDASEYVLGRLAVTVANILRGRHKPIYTPHVDAGDHVIVINASRIKVTGKKENSKQYMSYSGYIGGEKYTKLSAYRQKNPAFLIEHAVKGMLPGNRIASAMLRKLKVYAGSEHPHTAQQPTPLSLVK